jgi:hypothetical protein
MRSAKFGQGTNSNFIFTPDFAVKSLLSSTRALAGSQAAQHSVIVLSCASADVLPSASAAPAASEARPASFFDREFMESSPYGVRGSVAHIRRRQCMFSAVKISMRGWGTASAPRTFSHSPRSTRAAASTQ